MAPRSIFRSWSLAVAMALSALVGVACSDSESGNQQLECPDGQTLCGNVCADLSADFRNCGSCGEACGPGEVCSEGACDTSCGEGLTDCDGSCRDLTTDPGNCGACGTMCVSGEVCSVGACSFVCPATQTACDGLCVSTDNDRANCGTCGNACGADEVCSEGQCQFVCSSGLTDCSGSCRDTSSDRSNCGDCGVQCGADEACIDATCTLVCEGGAPDECNGACTNVAIDPSNCGACDVVCGAGEVCNMGSCELQCAPGLAQCGQTCTSTLTDPANCGACDVSCTTTATGAVGVCVGGGCQLTCSVGRDDCDNDLVMSAGNGCETSLVDDVNNCGACGQTCALPNAAGGCSASQCVLVACDSGFDNCNGMDADGCEVSLTTDARNCGACGVTCGFLESCRESMCELTPGENCDSAIPLVVGTSTYGWVASTSDHLLATPPCVAFGSITGPDVVFTYTSTINGFLTIDMTKPADNRFVFVGSGATCGSIAPADQDVCVSAFGPTSMSGGLRVFPNQTYSIYFNDTNSGGSPLPNPLDLTVDLFDCTGVTAQVDSLSPTSGSTTTTLRPTFTVTFDQAVDTSTGTIRITGDQGTSLVYDLSTAPDAVSFGLGSREIAVDPGVPFPAGESLTITWSGVNDALCGNPVATPTWQFEVITPPCTPGQGGVVGRTTRRVSTGISVGTEYYVAADTSTSGFVYVGGLTDLQRVPKEGGTVEDVDAAAGLSTANLGYEMLIDGSDIYTVNNSGAGTTGRIFRISSDAGATWSVLDAVTFPASPLDDFRAAEVYDGRIYLMTHEGSSVQGTQVWSFPAGVATSTTARLEANFAGQNCSGLAVDDTFFYAACGVGERLVRVERSTGSVTVLTDQLDLSSTNNSMYGVDLDADGETDVLYLQTFYEEGYYVCAPGSAAPFIDTHFVFGTGIPNYGMGLEPNARLFAYDDDNGDVVVIE